MFSSLPDALQMSARSQNVGCNRSSSRDSRRHFHPCAVLGVLAWVTVNFLTGKTPLVFCYVGVSGREAHI